MKFLCGILLAVAGWMGVGSVAAEPVTFTKDAPLRAEPKFDAAAVTQVKQNTQGEASGKQGPWLNIKVNNATGWALTTDINFGKVGVANSGGGGASLGSIFGRANQTASTTTATIGIRGVTPEIINHALGGTGSVNETQLAMLDKYQSTNEAGQTYARSQGLAALELQY